MGCFDLMKGVLDDMKRLKIELVEGTFFIFIESYAKFELYNEAIKVLDMMQNEFCVMAGTFNYNQLLNVLVDGNKFKFVENALDEGVKAVKGTPAGCKGIKSRMCKYNYNNSNIKYNCRYYSGTCTNTEIKQEINRKKLFSVYKCLLPTI